MLAPIALSDIEAARGRIAGDIVRTPLLRLNVDSDAAIYLKAENLQPIGSFKLRGAGNAIAMTSPDQLKKGVWTASAGNMAQGVAWHARRLGIPCTVVIPETAPDAKRRAVERLGARIVETTVHRWLQVFATRSFPGVEGLFIHAFADPNVMAGNGTIGLEIVEDLPDLDAVVIPFGGGGLSCGIASALRAVRPEARVYAAEFEEMAPLAASWEQGFPVQVPYQATFIDGIGGTSILPEMLTRARQLLNGVLTTTVPEVAAAVRLLAQRNRVVSEGAGAVPVAAALAGKAGSGKVVCVVSGGNIDLPKLATLLLGEIP